MNIETGGNKKASITLGGGSGIVYMVFAMKRVYCDVVAHLFSSLFPLER